MIDLDRGWASERLDLEPLAARSLVTRLRAQGWTVTAHIHPGHLASARVARAAALSPTSESHDGETRWVSPPAPAG